MFNRIDFYVSIGYSDLSELKPLFGDVSKIKKANPLTKRRRLSTARIEQL
jgi:hypothetical protein